jgi:hypothetical protein
MPHLLNKDTPYAANNVADISVVGKGDGKLLHTKKENPSFSDLVNLAHDCYGKDTSEQQMYNMYKHEMFALFMDLDDDSESYEECYYVFEILKKFMKPEQKSLVKAYTANNK